MLQIIVIKITSTVVVYRDPHVKRRYEWGKFCIFVDEFRAIDGGIAKSDESQSKCQSVVSEELAIAQDANSIRDRCLLIFSGQAFHEPTR